MAAQELDFSAFPVAKRAERVAEETAKGTPINFGYIPPARRTDEQHKAAGRIVGAMPRFGIRGRFRLESRRYKLWEFVRKVNGGKWPNWIWQLTGSCVGAGGGNMTIVTQGVEIALKGEAEEFLWPWWLYTYGRSRFHSGIRGPGEGSMGAGWAKAATTDGLFELDPKGQPDLPDPQITGGHAKLTAALEMQWSDGAKIGANWITTGRAHLYRTAALIRSADQLIDALANGYGATVASSFGFSPMAPPVTGSGADAIRLVTRWNGTWNHQTWFDEFWDHPTAGPVFRWGNNWGPNPHGAPAGDYPDNGVYITYAVADQILKDADTECFAFSGFDGFPARESELNFAAF
jgi:hypothetical protein